MTRKGEEIRELKDERSNWMFGARVHKEAGVDEEKIDGYVKKAQKVNRRLIETKRELGYYDLE